MFVSYAGESFAVVVLYSFFSFGRLKNWSLVQLGRWSSYTVTTVWEFARADSALGVLDELLPYRCGCWNRFDCSIKCYWSNAVYFLVFFSWVISTNFRNGINKLIFLVVVLSYILYNFCWNLCHLWRIRTDIYQISLLFSGYLIYPPPSPRPSPLCLRLSFFANLHAISEHLKQIVWYQRPIQNSVKYLKAVHYFLQNTPF